MNKTEIEARLKAIALGGEINIGGRSIYRTHDGLYRIQGFRTEFGMPMAIQGILSLGMQHNPRMNKSNERLFPIELRAISIHAPWAWLICNGYKSEEYRSRATKRRGLTLIHSSGSKDSDHILAEYKIPIQQIHRQAIIGAVNLVDCIEENGDYAYILEDAIAFPKPVKPVSGQQSIFWAASTPERIKAFNQAWAMLNN